jgi:hypothetical protein
LKSFLSFFIISSCFVFSSTTFSHTVSSTFAKGIKSIEKINKFTKNKEKASFTFQLVFITQEISSPQPGIIQSNKNAKIIGLAQKNKYQIPKNIKGNKTKLKNKFIKKIFL